MPSKQPDNEARRATDAQQPAGSADAMPADRRLDDRAIRACLGRRALYQRLPVTALGLATVVPPAFSTLHILTSFDFETLRTLGFFTAFDTGRIVASLRR